MWTDRRTDVRHINLIGGLVTHNPPQNGSEFNQSCLQYRGATRFSNTEYFSFYFYQHNNHIIATLISIVPSLKY